MGKRDVASRVARACYFDELATARALAYPAREAYEAAMNQQDSVYALAFDEHRALVFTRFRPMERR